MSKPTVQSIWDENDLDDYAAEQLASGRVWRLASQPWSPYPFGDPVRDSVLITADYRAEQRDDRHWQVFGLDQDGWQHVGWLVR